MVDLRILHAKNQSPRSKTVAFRPQTDVHTDTQTQRESKHTEDPFFRFFVIFYYLKTERTYIKDVGI